MPCPYPRVRTYSDLHRKQSEIGWSERVLSLPLQRGYFTITHFVVDSTQTRLYYFSVLAITLSSPLPYRCAIPAHFAPHANRVCLCTF